MTILDTAILNLMKQLENKEISWEEYKLKLKKILDSKNNNLADEEIKKEENISSSFIYEDNANYEDKVNYEDNVNFEDKVNVETAINNQPKITNILLHDEEVIEKENEIIKEETVELGIIGQKPENKTPTIQIKNLNKKYKHKHILKNVSFNVYPGEIHLLTGPCSSGKTTIIKSIVCAFPKDQIKGEILINNGWNILTATNVMIFTLLHFPCMTTFLTIKKETKSMKWVVISFFIPTVCGVVICMCTNFLYWIISCLW